MLVFVLKALKRPRSCFFFLSCLLWVWTVSLCIHCPSVCLHMVYNGDISKVCEATCSYHLVLHYSASLLCQVIEIQVVLCRSGGSL